MSAQPQREERHGVVIRRCLRGSRRQLHEWEIRARLRSPDSFDDFGYEVRWDAVAETEFYWKDSGYSPPPVGTEVWESICETCNSAYGHRFGPEILRGVSGEGLDWCRCCMPN